MTESPMILAYLTSAYARASDTFIRAEVTQLRADGHTVHTFSIRRPAASELVSDEIRRERSTTVDIVAAGPLRLLGAGLLELFRSPGRFLSVARLAQRVGTPGLKGRLWPQAYLLEAAFLARHLRALGVEHLHNHIGEGSASVAMLAGALAGIPYSVTVHGPNEFDRPTLLALGEKVRHSAFTVAISDYGRGQLFRWCDFADWSKIEVVRCGVGARFLDADPEPIPEAARFVCVGRLSEQKGQMMLIEAAGRLAREGHRFEVVLVGDGPLRAALQARIDALGIGGFVTLAGWADADRTRREIQAARALVLPSLAEGLPVVLMEALALGRPVISTYVAGIPELVEPGACGWLIPAGSIEPLVEAMRQAIAADVETLERMGRDGAARVAAMHDGAVNVRGLARLFAGLPADADADSPPASNPLAQEVGTPQAEPAQARRMNATR